MIYPTHDVHEWAQKYGLSLEPLACPKCGLLQQFTTPFVTENWRGVQADIHECGANYQAARAVSVDEEFNSRLKDLYGTLKLEEGEE